MCVSFTIVPSEMAATLKMPATTGGESFSLRATRNEERTVVPSGQATRSSGPTMSSEREIPPQPFPAGIGHVIWPMKSVVGFSGSAIPNAKEVFAPKKRWKFMPVMGSVKAAVICAIVGLRRMATAIWRARGNMTDKKQSVVLRCDWIKRIGNRVA